MANKMIKRDVITGLMNGTIAPTSEVAQAYFQNELDLLAKKAQNKKASKTQTENVGIKETIVATLVEIGKPATVSEIQSANVSLSALSNQKVSALLKQLVDNGDVTKTVDKKKSYFSATLVESEEEEE